jgi:hypothetical protein
VRPEGNRHGFPLGNGLSLSRLLVFLLLCLPALHQLLLLLAYDAVLLRIELLPLLLENVVANGFVFLNAAKVELPSTALSTGHQLSRIHLILSHLELILLINICDAFLLNIFYLSSVLHFRRIRVFSFTEVSVLWNILIILTRFALLNLHSFVI